MLQPLHSQTYCTTSGPTGAGAGEGVTGAELFADALLRDRGFFGRSPLSLWREGGRLTARPPPGDGIGPGEERVLCGLAGGGDMTDGLDMR